MKRAIERELGLGVSAGVSLTKVLAKVASKYQKPSGLTVIPRRHFQPLPMELSGLLRELFDVLYQETEKILSNVVDDILFQRILPSEN